MDVARGDLASDLIGNGDLIGTDLEVSDGVIVAEAYAVATPRVGVCAVASRGDDRRATNGMDSNLTVVEIGGDASIVFTLDVVDGNLVDEELLVGAADGVVLSDLATVDSVGDGDSVLTTGKVGLVALCRLETIGSADPREVVLTGATGDVGEVDCAIGAADTLDIGDLRIDADDTRLGHYDIVNLDLAACSGSLVIVGRHDGEVVGTGFETNLVSRSLAEACAVGSRPEVGVRRLAARDGYGDCAVHLAIASLGSDIVDGSLDRSLELVALGERARVVTCGSVGYSHTIETRVAAGEVVVAEDIAIGILATLILREDSLAAPYDIELRSSSDEFASRAVDRPSPAALRRASSEVA